MNAKKPIRLLILGASGMLGNTALRWFAQKDEYEVFGSVRDVAAQAHLQERVPRAHLLSGVDVKSASGLRQLMERSCPDVVINCIGVVKQLAGADQPHIVIPANALLPHRLARCSAAVGARLVHVSTDCVFSGRRGAYTETDEPDAEDLYGRTKLMGEVDYPNAITLRTSIIGHELSTAHALVGWFLAQAGPVPGFSRALFSALPTVELARVIGEYVIPQPALRGIYHVAGPTISKLELLRLVAQAYGRDNPIQAENMPVVDRSLKAERFQAATGYQSPDWSELVRRMRAFG